MFRSARWRSDKNKVKAEFKLQFHATQIPELNLETLTVSVLTGDAGKPVVRSEKVVVRDAACRWETPIYETVKFVRDAKTGKFGNKTLRFVVGTSAANVGEVSVDLANFVSSTKTSVVSLPLKNSKCKGILHISVERQRNEDDFRLEDEQEDTNSKRIGSPLSSLTRNEFQSSKGLATMNDLLINDSRNVMQSRNPMSSIASDMTMLSSECSSGINTPIHDRITMANVLDVSTFTSFNGFVASPNKSGNVSPNPGNHQLKWAWLGDSDLGTTTDDSSQSTLTGERTDEGADMDVDKLKATIAVLIRQVDLSELELQTLRKQIVKENKKWQDISQELVCVKDERDALQSELATLKPSETSSDLSKSKQIDNDSRTLLKELKNERDLNADLRLQLQKTRDSNDELMVAVKDLEAMAEGSHSASKADFDATDEVALEEMVKGEKRTSLFEHKIMDLCSEIEVYKREKDDIEMQMEQLALDYEILKQENHSLLQRVEQSQLEEQLKAQYECCSSSAKVNELETKIGMLERDIQLKSESFSDAQSMVSQLQSHVKVLEEEIERQVNDFEFNLAAVMQLKVEQEERAIKAEDALRDGKWNNRRVAEKFHKDFKRLCFEMQLAFDANEKAAIVAVAEASELRKQKSDIESTLTKFEEEFQTLKGDYEANLSKLSDELDCKTNEFSMIVAEACRLSRELERQKLQEAQLTEEFSDQIRSLNEELHRLTSQNKSVHKRSASSLVAQEPDHSEAPIALQNSRVRSGKEHAEEIKGVEAEEVDPMNVESKAQSNQRENGDAEERFAEREGKQEMEHELKELQQRYSELSVKFAEVEGERQQLVMEVRTLRSSRGR